MTVSSPRLICEDIVEVTTPHAEQSQALAAKLREFGLGDEVVAGIKSVSVRFDPEQVSSSAVIQTMNSVLREAQNAVSPTSQPLMILVEYGGDAGPDFLQVCESTGLSGEALIAAHTRPIYSVDMIGFTPGFAYLGGLPDELNVPRLQKPRQRVRAGSVGIKGNQSGLYALSGPGGWPIIGRTSHTLFDPKAEEPFVLHPGMRVRFVNAEAL